MKTHTLFISTLVLGGSLLLTSNASSPYDVPTAIVNLSDLDTTRPAGKEELYHRLTRAAHMLCRSLDPSESRRNLQPLPQYHACIEQAVSGALARIIRPEFTDYVASRVGKPDRSGLQLAAR